MHTIVLSHADALALGVSGANEVYYVGAAQAKGLRTWDVVLKIDGIDLLGDTRLHEALATLAQTEHSLQILRHTRRDAPARPESGHNTTPMTEVRPRDAAAVPQQVPPSPCGLPAGGGGDGGGGGGGGGGEAGVGWLQQMRQFLAENGISDANLRSTMKVVEALASGSGIPHPHDASNVFAHGRCIDLESDLEALRHQGKEWLKKEDDSSRGWKLHTPLNKLIAFQAHVRGEDGGGGRAVFRIAPRDAAVPERSPVARRPFGEPCDSDDDFADPPSASAARSRPQHVTEVAVAAAAGPGAGSRPLGLAAVRPSSDSEEDMPLAGRKRALAEATQARRRAASAAAMDMDCRPGMADAQAQAQAHMFGESYD